MIWTVVSGMREENFKRSRKVDLIHPLENETAYKKRSRRQLGLWSLTDK